MRRCLFCGHPDHAGRPCGYPTVFTETCACGPLRAFAAKYDLRRACDQHPQGCPVGCAL